MRLCFSSSDSVLMLYSYAGIPTKGFALFAPKSQITRESEALPTTTPDPAEERTLTPPRNSFHSEIQQLPPTRAESPKSLQDVKSTDEVEIYVEDAPDATDRIKENTMSELSIALTLISILVAFRYVRH